MDKYNKYIFKKQILVFDFLKAKKLPEKSKKYFENSNNTNIKTNYHVNQLANKLHPGKQNVTISKIINHGNGSKSFILKGDKCQLAFFRPGQYITLNVVINGVTISRPYSIASSPLSALNENIYEVIIQKTKNGFFSNYMLNDAKVGNKLWVSGPEGEFYHVGLRDNKNVVAIAGNIGITPFLSFARDIRDNNSTDINLTILYSVQKKKDIVYYNELNQLSKLPNINVIYFLTKDKKSNMNNKHIDLSSLKKYASKNTTFFICGSNRLYEGMKTLLTKLKIPSKNIRYEVNQNVCLDQDKKYKNVGKKNIYKIKVHMFDEVYTIKGLSKDSILVSLQKAKLHTQSKCLSGRCAWCRIRLISGKLFVSEKNESRRMKDRIDNIYHSCVSYPVSDVEIESY